MTPSMRIPLWLNNEKPMMKAPGFSKLLGVLMSINA